MWELDWKHARISIFKISSHSRHRGGGRELLLHIETAVALVDGDSGDSGFTRK